MAIQIIVTTMASAYNSNERKVSSTKWLKQLDGVSYSEELCSDYFEIGGNLDDAGITGGKILLRYNPASRNLESVVTYECKRRLNAAEKAELLSETRAQLSDGIGEGQIDLADGSPVVFVNLLPLRAKSTVRQSSKKSSTSKKVETAKTTKRQINICAAASRGDIAKLQTAIDARQNLDVPSKGFYALDLAVGSGHIEAAELLIENGANLESRGPMDFTPLLTCVASGGIKGKTRDKILQLLLVAGAKVNAKSRHAGSALDIAYNYGRGKSIKETLIKNGAKKS